jgi:hypothetical protein
LPKQLSLDPEARHLYRERERERERRGRERERTNSLPQSGIFGTNMTGCQE